jgi:hypothetical protein
LLETPYSTYESTQPLISNNSQSLPLAASQTERFPYTQLSVDLDLIVPLTLVNRQSSESKTLQSPLASKIGRYPGTQLTLDIDFLDSRNQNKSQTSEEDEDKELIELMIRFEANKDEEAHNKEIIEYLKINNL